MSTKDHTTNDACDARHDCLSDLKATVGFQGRVLWAILMVGLAHLAKVLFFVTP